MAGEWKSHEVAELISQRKLCVGDGYRAKNEELGMHGLPFARAGNINGGFHFEGADRFPENNLTRVGDKISRPGDVVFTSKGTVGRFAFVKSNTPCFVFAPQLCYWRSLDHAAIDPRFLYFWMSGPDFYQQYKSVAGQTDMAEYVSLTDQRRMHIALPPIEEQRAIAHILGTLDDKIELNRRMNETLEAMARAIFKSWFVDFDPVRAKMERRWKRGQSLPGLPADLYDLFPSRLVDSELGEIPQGWSVDTIKSRASNIQYGFTQSATDEPIGPRFLRITDIRGGTVNWASVPFCQATHVEREKYRIMDGDIFIARTGASTGDNAYVIEPPPAVFASYLIRVQFASRGIGRYVAEYTRTPDYADYIAGAIGGSAQPNASAQALVATSVVFPCEDIADAYYQMVRPLDLRRATNGELSRTFATMRDRLLPKLISGEIPVKDAERFIGRAV
jgi:type I restriction enzyme S subunit